MIDKRKIGFTYTVEIVRADGTVRESETIDNLIPDVGLTYLLTAAMAGGSQAAAWYIGVFGNSRAPLPGDTLTTFLADAGELTSYTTTGGERLPLVADPIANGVYSNDGTRAVFTFPTGATVRGGFISSNALQGGTTGTFLSATLFTSPKIPEAGEAVRVLAGLSLTA